MKTLVALLAFAVVAFAKPAIAEPAIKVSNRQFEDGTWSSKEINREKLQSIERFYISGAKIPYQTIVYKHDARMQLESGIYYNAKSQVFQKCTYVLDGEDRIIQEVVYSPQGKLSGTNNYIYGTRGGLSKLINVDRYDSNGVLIPKGKVSKRPR